MPKMTRRVRTAVNRESLGTQLDKLMNENKNLETDLNKMRDVLEKAKEIGCVSGVCFGQHNGNKDITDAGGIPIVTAIRQQKVDVVKEMLMNGINTNIIVPGTNGSTLVYEAIRYGTVKMIELLVKHGAFLDIKDDECNSPLMVAVMEKKCEFILALRTYGCSENSVNLAGNTPLMECVDRLSKDSSYIETLKVLLGVLETQAIQQIVHPKSGLTCLGLVLCLVPDDIVLQVLSVLLKFGCDLNLRDAHGRSGLHYICGEYCSQAGYFKRKPLQICNIVTFLLENHANPNASNDNCETPLHIAVAQEMPKIAEILLQFGADKEHRNFNGLKPLDLCKSDQQNIIMEKIFLETKKVEISDRQFNTKPISALKEHLSSVQRIITTIQHQHTKNEDIANDIREVQRNMKEATSIVTNQLEVLFKPDESRDPTIDVIYRACMIVSRMVGSDWKMLARHLFSRRLDYHEVIIQEIEERHSKVGEQAFQALLVWQRTNGKEATVAKLLESLAYLGLENIRETVQERCGQSRCMTASMRTHSNGLIF